MCFKATEGQPRCEVLDQPRQTFTANGCSNVFANADSRGYYFTEYTSAAVRALSASVGGLKPIERIGLLGDEWWMVRACRHDIGVYLDLAGSLARDETAAITEAIASRLGFTLEYLGSPAQKPRLPGVDSRAVRAARWPPWRSRAPPPTATSAKSRRADCSRLWPVRQRYRHTGARPRTGGRIRSQPDVAARHAAPAVLRVAAASGDAALYDRYIAHSRSQRATREYYRFFGALSSFRDPALVQRTLNFAISPAVRTQDTGMLIGGLLGQAHSRDAAWAFVQAKWPTLTQKLGTFQGIPDIIGAVSSFCSTEAAAQVKQFFARNPVPSSERTLQRSLERIENCAALVARQSPALNAWMSAAR